MPGDSELVHLVWIGNRLSLLEQLTLKLYQRVGLTPHLWSYDPIEAVPPGVIQRNASEIMPRSSLFTFESERGFEPGKGKGAYSQWSDLFQLHVLGKFGGWYSQLDVSCLRLPDPMPPAYFFPFGYTVTENEGGQRRQRVVNGLQTCVMRLPANSHVGWKSAAQVSIHVNKQTSETMGWFDSMFIITQYVIEAGLSKYIADWSTVIDFGAPDYMLGFKTPPQTVNFIHWSNAWSKQYKNDPRPGTFYYNLLRSVDLV